MRRRNSTNSNLTSPGGRQRVSRTSSTSHRLTLDQGTCQPTLTPKVCPRLPYLVRHRLAQTPPNVWPPFPYPLLHLQLHLLISMTFPPLTRRTTTRRSPPGDGQSDHCQRHGSPLPGTTNSPTNTGLISPSR